MKKFLKYLFLFFLFLGILVGLYACLIEPFRLVISEYTVKTNKWNSEKPLKIVLMSDIHSINPWMTESHLNEIVQKVNELNPDVVLLLGDYVATHPFGLQINPNDGVRPYKNIKSLCGTYAVVGNHDLSGPDGWPEALQGTGIPVLRNDVRKANCNEQSFWIAGLDEFRLGHVDIQKTIAKTDGKMPIIILTHSPDVFVNLPASIALTVAGHTHGGQFRLPFIGAVPAVIPSKYGARFARGHIIEDGKDLVVSSGLGMTGLPIRFLCPPEITVVTLEKLD